MFTLKWGFGPLSFLWASESALASYPTLILQRHLSMSEDLPETVQ